MMLPTSMVIVLCRARTRLMKSGSAQFWPVNIFVNTEIFLFATKLQQKKDICNVVAGLIAHLCLKATIAFGSCSWRLKFIGQNARLALGMSWISGSHLMGYDHISYLIFAMFDDVQRLSSCCQSENKVSSTEV